MECELPSQGAEATRKLYLQYQTLLQLVGNSNLHCQDSDGDNQGRNQKVSQLISSMKASLNTIRYSYDFCVKELKQNQDKLQMLTSSSAVQEKTTAHSVLEKELQDKNNDLETVIDTMNSIFTLTNSLNKYVT